MVRYSYDCRKIFSKSRPQMLSELCRRQVQKDGTVLCGNVGRQVCINEQEKQLRTVHMEALRQLCRQVTD